MRIASGQELFEELTNLLDHIIVERQRRVFQLVLEVHVANRGMTNPTTLFRSCSHAIFAAFRTNTVVKLCETG
ncbi:MAG TPA: hypothetical protein VMR18_00815 [Candidatus Saccharimonadales bacterium]|nr:hypothetical protein [Candidatus Saccharimonadales bacterium]